VRLVRQDAFDRRERRAGDSGLPRSQGEARAAEMAHMFDSIVDLSPPKRIAKAHRSRWALRCRDGFTSRVSVFRISPSVSPQLHRRSANYLSSFPHSRPCQMADSAAGPKQHYGANQRVRK